MAFENIIAQQRSIGAIQNAIHTGKLPQAYIFSGPAGTGKLLTAFTLAKAINCQNPDEDARPCNTCASCQKINNFMHPDITFIFPTPNFDLDEKGAVIKIKKKDEIQEDLKDKDAKQYLAYIEAKKTTPYKNYTFDTATAIRIEQIRGLHYGAFQGRHEAKYKVIIVEDCDKLTRQAANAFLKTLEEPPPNTLFIFTCENKLNLLPTILSRCICLNFTAIPPDKIEAFLLQSLYCQPHKARLYSRLAKGNLERAICLHYDENLSGMDSTINLLNIVLSGDDIAFMTWIDDNFPKTAKNANTFEDIIQYLTLWLKDLQVYPLNPQEIVFVNHTELIERFLATNPCTGDAVRDMTMQLNGFLQKAQGNVSLKLILCQVYFMLKEGFFNA